MQVELRQGPIADCQSFWKGRRRSCRQRAAATVSVCGKLGRAGRVGSRALRHTGTTQAEAHLGKALPTQRLLSLARVGLCSPRAPVNQVDPASWHRPPATCERSGDQKWPKCDSSPFQDGLLPEMLLLCQPPHWRTHDGRHDPRPQCLLHRPHGALSEQKV